MVIARAMRGSRSNAYVVHHKPNHRILCFIPSRRIPSTSSVGATHLEGLFIIVIINCFCIFFYKSRTTGKK